MESRRHCAYNLTRKCLISSEVDAGDFVRARLDERLPGLASNSYASLWVVPFRETPDTRNRVQLDLVYLDGDCRVIDVVESFPSHNVSPSAPPASSLLVLPTSSILLSQIQPGDQIIVCAAEDMPRRAGIVTASRGNVSGVVESEQSFGGIRQGTRLQPDGHGRQTGDFSTDESPEDEQAGDEGEYEPEVEDATPSRNWLSRFLFPDPPDPRLGQREPPPGLTAQIWTGEVLQPYKIRDISKTGLFVETEQRWYRGTLIRVRLTKVSPEGYHEERTITVQMRVARLAGDGVGLQFVPPSDQDLRRGRVSSMEGASNKQLEEFLEWLAIKDIES